MSLRMKRRWNVPIHIAAFYKPGNDFSVNDERWLYKHEAVRQGWIKDKDGVIQEDSFFAKLLKENVTCYYVGQEDIMLVGADRVAVHEDFRLT